MSCELSIILPAFNEALVIEDNLKTIEGLDIPGLKEALNEAKEEWAIANNLTIKQAKRFLA